MSSLECLHRIQRIQMYVKLYRGDKCMSSLVCLHRIHKRQMYVKFNVSTQDTQETNVCQVW